MSGKKVLLIFFGVVGVIILMLLGFTTRAHACGCCAEENDWVHRELTPSDTIWWDEKYKNLHFTDGYFEDVPAYEEYYKVKDTRISDENKKLKFVGKGFKGVFYLDGNAEYSHKDIGFEVNKDSPAANKALMLHELIFTGHMTIKARGRADRELSAKLILQGINTSHCFGFHYFSKWMIKLHLDILAGAGILVVDDPTVLEQEVKE